MCLYTPGSPVSVSTTIIATIQTGAKPLLISETKLIGTTVHLHRKNRSFASIDMHPTATPNTKSEGVNSEPMQILLHTMHLASSPLMAAQHSADK